MARIEELPKDRSQSTAKVMPSDSSAPGLSPDALASATPFPPKPGVQVDADASIPSASMPPAMAAAKSYSADELVTMLNRTPLFMTELDETDGAGGENIELEALKALAYEGTRAEVADNFRTQGNDMARAKNWRDAREFYTRALAALRGEPAKEEPEKEAGEGETRRGIEEACCVNRALCNLEMKNYRACNLDCAAAIRLNSRNVKAFYRSGLACLAIDKLEAAMDACAHGLAIDPANVAVKNLLTKVEARKALLEKTEQARLERLQRQRAEAATLWKALADRNISVNRSKNTPVDVDDAKVQLADPLDATSALSVPVLLLYPTHAQSDVVKAFLETDTLLDHFEYIFPCPWDTLNEFSASDVECYMDTVTGGLVKIGKKLPLVKFLSGGKVQITDGMCRIIVVPKAKTAEWIAEVKKRKAG